MSLVYKCRLCRRGTVQPMEVVKFWDPEKREVPGVQEGESCYIEDHLCERCASFYRTYVRNAEYKAAYILSRDEDPISEVVYAQEEEMPANCDGAWDFIVTHDRLPNEVLDEIKIVWHTGPGVPMTIKEVVRQIIQKEKEAAAKADEPAEESEEN